MELKNVTFWKSNTGHWHMTGQIFGDDRGKYKDGTKISTSRVISIFELYNKILLVYTRNSKYLIKDCNECLGIEDLKIVKK